MVYQCNSVRWREDIAQENLSGGLTHYQVDRAGARMSWEPPEKQFPNARSDEWTRFQFNRYLETYLDRNLKFDHDILNAFAGLTSEAGNKRLKCCWGLLKKHIGMDVLWLPSKWLTRRPGFPSWSWAGWKGPIIPFTPASRCSETVWQHRKSWIDWYIFKKSSGKFHLISSGYAPRLEAAVSQAESEELQQEARLASMLSEHDGADPSTKDDVDSDKGSFASLFWRLCQGHGVQAPSERNSPYPLYCTPTIDEQAILFRTMTAYVAISTLGPEGRASLMPRDDQLLLPSASTLHLYAFDGTHIGSAWAHTQDLSERVAAFDREAANQAGHSARLQIEVALIAGPVQGYWRTRMEIPTTWQYMLELSKAGLNLEALYARYGRRLAYEQAIAKVYVSMVRARQDAESTTEGIEDTLTMAFWEELKIQVSLLHLESDFPGHRDRELQSVLHSLRKGARGVTADEEQSFFKVMLIGNLGDGVTNGSGGIKERAGIGEVRDNALGMIQGLAARDVMLR